MMRKSLSCQSRVLLLAGLVSAGAVAESDWPVHGADAAGTRYSLLAQINTNNVHRLKTRWVYRTGEMERRGAIFAQSKDSNIPVKIDNHLIVCTPFNRVISLDPRSGEQQWVVDPDVALDFDPRIPYACRGVAYWLDPAAAAGSLCQKRLLLSTNDIRLFALDLPTGRRCPGFGNNGEVSVPVSKPLAFKGEVHNPMPPTIINGVAVLGSAIEDSHRPDTPSGRVQAFSARTGEKMWEWDPIPKDRDDPAMATWGGDSAFETGSGNVWGFMAADEARDLLFLPTTSPAPDAFGAMRAGRNDYTDSLVALRGATGELIWHFQITHHDLWGFDIASQPLLVDIPRDGKLVPVVVQNIKQGLVFVFHRETGEPFFPIE